MQTFEVNDQSFSGYMALPEVGTGAGILVYHAWWGLTPFFQQVCDNLADEGFVALAPDIFHGATAQTIDEAKQLRGQVDRKAAKKDIRVAIDYLSGHEAISRPDIGSIGFSYGCGFAIESARLRPKIVKAISLFYGTGGGKLDKTDAAFQGHFAENDEWGANSEKAQRLEKRIVDANQTVTFHIYPDTTHWFFERGNDAYNEEAAQLAWQRTIDFFQTQLY